MKTERTAIRLPVPDFCPYAPAGKPYINVNLRVDGIYDLIYSNPPGPPYDTGESFPSIVLHPYGESCVWYGTSTTTQNSYAFEWIVKLFGTYWSLELHWTGAPWPPPPTPTWRKYYGFGPHGEYTSFYTDARPTGLNVHYHA